MLDSTDSALPFCHWDQLLIGTDTWFNAACGIDTSTHTLYATYTDGLPISEDVSIRWSSSMPLHSPVLASSAGLSLLSSRVSSTSTSSWLVTISSDHSSESYSPTPQHNSNIGAIAGGAVGGVAIVAAFCFGIFWLCMRRKRDNQNSQTLPNHGAVTYVHDQPEYKAPPTQPLMSEQD